MKRLYKALAFAATLTVCLAACLMPSAAEGIVELDFLHECEFSKEESSVRWIENDDGSFTMRPQSSLETGGRAIVYIHSAPYSSDMKIAYDIEFNGNIDSDFLQVSISTWGDYRFLHNDHFVPLEEKICEVAGVEPVYEMVDEVPTARLPAGSYKGVIDVSEYIEEGFDHFSHLILRFNGKNATIRQLQLVSGVEVTPPPTTTTTEAPTTTTEAGADTAPTTTEGGAAETPDDDNSTSIVIAIVAGAVLLVAVSVGGTYFVMKKAQK